MSQESDHKNIHVALLAAQKEFGRVIKDSTNSHFTSKYANLSNVVSAVVPVMNAHGCVVYHHLIGDGLSVMRTTFLHAATDTSIFCDVPLVVIKNDMQGMKSATTYAKRIGLESLSGIAPEDDDGNDAAKAAPRKSARQAQKDGSFDVFQAAIHSAKLPIEAATIWCESPSDTWPVAWLEPAKDKVVDVFRSSLAMAGDKEGNNWIREHDEALQMLPDDWAENLVQEAKDMRANWIKRQQQSS
jgi:hypothetical protein